MYDFQKKYARARAILKIISQTNDSRKLNFTQTIEIEKVTTNLNSRHGTFWPKILKDINES